ncbi:hypothetical protein [Tsukamurella soli]|uniref:hypothetical protein n=1 Tax=Tsukamurella soli TaxID=644556 RepID=UPI0031ECFFC6
MGNRTAPVAGGRYAGRAGWSHPRIQAGAVRVNHTHDCVELYRRALERWEAARGLWLQSYAERETARREQAAYREPVGTIRDDVSGILDGDAGPRILEWMLAEHDAVPSDAPTPGASGAREPRRPVLSRQEDHGTLAEAH